MALPRVLTLGPDATLRMTVLPEMAGLRGTEMALPGREAGDKARTESLRKMEWKNAAAEIEMEFQAKPVRLSISDGAQEILIMTFDTARRDKEFSVGDYAASFPAANAGRHRLRIFLDGSAAECFLDEQLALTSRVYRAPTGNLHIEIPQAELSGVESLRVWPLRPISPDRLTS